ncbi:hypothetical protein GCM10025876_02890 [Demequina litorisediminis]|uniref:Uncharacterized protein n=1 Tax=Demequina litorisediminis TaxID=1849022 RepID=A0ABQ6I8M1_9MICO|nr:hypothetical protein GCM10025876_02890 [Demequina litorisediminis]
MVRIGLRVIMLRTSARMVNDVRPNDSTEIPISIMSPCFALETKSISEMYLVTALRLPSLKNRVNGRFLVDPPQQRSAEQRAVSVEVLGTDPAARTEQEPFLRGTDRNGRGRVDLGVHESLRVRA